MKRKQHEPKLRDLINGVDQNERIDRERIGILEGILGLIVKHPDFKHVFEQKPEPIDETSRVQ